jgi:hypothetical protein
MQNDVALIGILPNSLPRGKKDYEATERAKGSRPDKAYLYVLTVINPELLRRESQRGLN